MAPPSRPHPSASSRHARKNSAYRFIFTAGARSSLSHSWRCHRSVLVAYRLRLCAARLTFASLRCLAYLLPRSTPKTSFDFALLRHGQIPITTLSTFLTFNCFQCTRPAIRGKSTPNLFYFHVNAGMQKKWEIKLQGTFFLRENKNIFNLVSIWIWEYMKRELIFSFKICKQFFDCFWWSHNVLTSVIWWNMEMNVW